MADTIVVGAGISGLVAAYGLVRAGEEVVVLEASEWAGGVIRTLATDGFLVELGPNSVRMTDEMEALLDDLGLTDEVLTADPRAPRYVYHDGKLQRAPMGPASLVTTGLLSARAKLRLLGEPFAGRGRGGDEPTIAEFVTRRLGREIHDVLVSAFISGVYAGDTTRLSADAVFPKLVELEREHGSILRGGLARMRAKKSAAPAPSAAEPKRRRRPLTISSLEGGLARLPVAIAEALGKRLRLGAPVVAIERDGERFVVRTEGDRFDASRLVVATPAREAAALLAPLAPRAAELLDAIEYPPLVSVALAYRFEEVVHSCEGFGFLAPRVAGLRTLGGIFGSSLFANRAPEGWHTFTCFVGGATDPSAIDLDDDALVAQVAADLERVVGASGEPRVLSVTRWSRAIPQYTIGHRARVAEIERDAERAGVRLLGNYLHGVSVGECIAAAAAAGSSRDGYRTAAPQRS